MMISANNSRICEAIIYRTCCHTGMNLAAYRECVWVPRVPNSAQFKDGVKDGGTWCQVNGMSFNISKTCLLRFHNRTANEISTDYTVNNVSLSSLDHCRDLGIIISTDMSWSRHCNAITAKAYQTLGLLRRTLSSIPTKIKKLYISLVRSSLTVLRYGHHILSEIYNC